MASENKTQATGIDVAQFVAAVADPVRREDAHTLIAMMERVSGAPPAMWGPSIIGFGSYDYHYDSGRTGTMARIGFSPRKTEQVLYVLNDFADRDVMLARLGKHRTGKSCLYIKRLSDVDVGMLEELVAASWADMAQRYP